MKRTNALVTIDVYEEAIFIPLRHIPSHPFAAFDSLGDSPTSIPADKIRQGTAKSPINVA